MSRLNVIERDNLAREVQRLRDRISELEALFQGQPVGTARIADAAITNAKINDLSVSKLTAGTLGVPADLGQPATGFVRIDGEENHILVNDGSDNRIVIGETDDQELI
jgi:hypothetical protein